MLNQGLDTREEGLIWIVKILWYLGEDVLLSRFPQFLDYQSVTYLLDYAKLSLAAEEMVDEVADT